jgi:hypothetical protein
MPLVASEAGVIVCLLWLLEEAGRPIRRREEERGDGRRAKRTVEQAGKAGDKIHQYRCVRRRMTES